MPRPTLFLVALLCAAVPAVAAAQPSTPDPIRAQVDALARSMPAGIELQREPWMGSLAQGAFADTWVRLLAGRRSDFIPVCDQDCTAVDLRIYDEAGAELAHASDTGDIDILSITPTRSGRYRLRLTMTGCTAAPCRYGIAMFGRAVYHR